MLFGTPFASLRNPPTRITPRHYIPRSSRERFVQDSVVLRSFPVRFMRYLLAHDAVPLGVTGSDFVRGRIGPLIFSPYQLVVQRRGARLGNRPWNKTPQGLTLHSLPIAVRSDPLLSRRAHVCGGKPVRPTASHLVLMLDSVVLFLLRCLI